MKSFIAFALIVAVATGAVIKPSASLAEQAQIQEIVAAIQSPNTDPATAALLEAMLMETLGIHPAPVAVGPAIVDAFEPIAVGPALVDMPVAVVDSAVAAPAPAIVPGVVAPAAVAPENKPMVQIIVNVQSPGAVAVDSPAPVATPAIVPGVVAPGPSPVVLPAPAVPEVHEPVQVVDSAPEAVHVVEFAPEMVQVVDYVPEPVLVAQPVLPSPAINLPDILN